ncbi:MAG: penicillin-binding protein 2 [Patescibacteria group bacterium]
MKLFHIFNKKNYIPGNDFFCQGLSIRDESMSRRNKASWVEGSFIDYKIEEISTGNKNYLGLSSSPRSLSFFFILILFIIFVLLSKAVYLQLLKGDYYLSLAENNRLRLINIPAPRGIIYDRLGRQLVKNVPIFEILLTPSDILTENNDVISLKNWLGQNLAEIDAEWESSFNKILASKKGTKDFYEPNILTDNLTYEKAVAMQIESQNFPGVQISIGAQREYQHDFGFGKTESLSHILGYKGKLSATDYADFSDQGYLYNDYIGKTGVEATFEKNLRGRYGREQIEVDSLGRAIKIIGQEDLQKGDNLYLSIDAVMQAKLEALLKNRLVKLGKVKTAAIIIDPNDGQVLSLISLPGYDNNLFSVKKDSLETTKLFGDTNQPMFNRVISGEYPSGSTIKPLISLAALQEKIITENTVFLSNGGLRISEWFFPDWKAGGHGYTNVRKAIAESVNTFFYIIGGGWNDFVGLGVEKIGEYLQMFGVGSKTQIDLPNEATGFVPSKEWKENYKKERWYIGDTYHLAIGQGDLLVTPLQMAIITSTIANGGKLLKPQIINHIYDQNEKKEQYINPDIFKQSFVDEKNFKIVQSGMRQAVTLGSAKILRDLPVTSSAKTGTAQSGGDKTPHAWFVAYAPAEKPEIVLTILCEEAGDGSGVSALVAHDFLQWYFRDYKKSLSTNQ